MVLMILLTKFIARREISQMLLCPIALCEITGIIITPQVTALGRLPRVVILVLVVMPPLLWLMLDMGRIWMINSYH